MEREGGEKVLEYFESSETSYANIFYVKFCYKVRGDNKKFLLARDQKETKYESDLRNIPEKITKRVLLMYSLI